MKNNVRIRSIFIVIFCLAIFLVLTATPYMANFEFRSMTCEINPPEGIWLATLLNFRHIFNYSLLLVFAYLAFPKRPLAILVIMVLLVTIGVEMEQSIFNHGHCRIRDMLPNLFAVGLGVWGAIQEFQSIGSEIR